jgi:alpha-tubulin suppressor-like RCC1 family protein
LNIIFKLKRYGQLGFNGGSVSLPNEVFSGGVLSGKNLNTMASGSYHSCTISSDYNAYCWGYNSFYFNFLIL